MHGVFFQIEDLFSLKNARYPQFSFWIPKALAKFYFLRRHSFKLHKNIPLLVGTAHRKP